MGSQSMEGPPLHPANRIEVEQHPFRLVVPVALLVEVDTAIESGMPVDEAYLECEQLFRRIHASTQ